MTKWLAVGLATVVAALIWTSGALAQEEMFITKGINSLGFQGMFTVTPAQDSGGSATWNLNLGNCKTSGTYGRLVSRWELLAFHES